MRLQERIITAPVKPTTSRRPALERFMSQETGLPESVILYGSFYNGHWKPGQSDIDLLYVDMGENPYTCHKRIFFEDLEIHIARITLGALREDALHMRYGFLYISKLLNPHIFIWGSKNREIIWSLVTPYLETYCFPDIFSDNKPLTVEEIIARIYLIHLQNFPHYALKLLNSFTIKSFAHLRNQFLTFVERSNLVTNVDDHFALAIIPSPDYRAYYHEKVRLTWWQTYQNYRSESDFLVTTINKPDKIIERNQYNIDELIRFLKREAHYETINCTST